MDTTKLDAVVATVGIKGDVVVIKFSRAVTKVELNRNQANDLIATMNDLLYPDPDTYSWGGINEDLTKEES